jgi:hypothetical protein
MSRLKRAEHVIEGTILHHQNHDVPKTLNSGQSPVECH